MASIKRCPKCAKTYDDQRRVYCNCGGIVIDEELDQKLVEFNQSLPPPTINIDRAPQPSSPPHHERTERLLKISKPEKRSSGLDKFLMLFGLIGIIVIIYMVVSQIPTKEQGMKDFRNQMGKDPATWTKQERDSFNSFMEWSDNN